MYRRSLCVAILVLFVASLVQAGGTLIWVSDAATPAGDAASQNVDPNLVDINDPWDQGWVDLLEANGYDVDYVKDGSWNGSLTDEQVAQLEAADLVIISRNTNSWNMRDASIWNAISTPMVQLSPFLNRANRWKWLNSNDLRLHATPPAVDLSIELAEELLGIEDVNNLIDPNDPNSPTVTVDIFDTNVGAGSMSGNLIAEVGNGELIGMGNVDSQLPYVMIASWEPNVEFYTGASQSAPGARLLFNAGSAENDADNGFYYGAGIMNLNEVGQALFLKLIRDLLPQVVWVSDAVTPVASSVDNNVDPNLYDPTLVDINEPWDQGWVDMLEANGYAVNYDTKDQSWRGSLTEEQKAQLEDADLVIVSRNTNSWEMRNAGLWNGISTPMVQLSPFLTRSNRWKWLDNQTLTLHALPPTVDLDFDLAVDLLDPNDPNDLIDPNNPDSPTVAVEIYDAGVGSGRLSGLQATDVGNGQLITNGSVDSSLPYVTIALWDADVEFYPGSGEMAPGARLVFNAGTADTTADDGYFYGAGMMNLNDLGVELFLMQLDELLTD